MSALKQFGAIVVTLGFTLLLGWFFAGTAWPFVVAACFMSWALGCLCGQYVQRFYQEPGRLIINLIIGTMKKAGAVVRGPWKLIEGGKKEDEEENHE